MEKILVVNNDMDTMTLLKELLEKKSYKVEYTSNGKESITIAKNFEPDVVLVDVLQQAWIRELKTNPATNEIPVIMMTGYSGNEKINASEADDIIQKPFFLDQLEQKIKITLNGKNKAG